jgi:hypothetical protein
MGGGHVARMGRAEMHTTILVGKSGGKKLCGARGCKDNVKIDHEGINV